MMPAARKAQQNQTDDEDEAPAWRWHRQPPIEELHEDMTAADIAHSLEFLTFVDGFALLKIDRGVRDYLLRSVRQR